MHLLFEVIELAKVMESVKTCTYVAMYQCLVLNFSTGDSGKLWFVSQKLNGLDFKSAEAVVQRS